MDSQRKTPDVLLLSLIYFGLVFGAGFIFGVIRTMYIAPALGEQIAQLIEAPFMLVTIILAALLVVRRYAAARSDLAVVGALAAILVLVADLLVGIGLRHMSVYEVLLGRDIVTGSVYYSLIAAFGAMPYVLWSESRSS